MAMHVVCVLGARGKWQVFRMRLAMLCLVGMRKLPSIAHEQRTMGWCHWHTPLVFKRGVALSLTWEAAAA